MTGLDRSALDAMQERADAAANLDDEAKVLAEDVLDLLAAYRRLSAMLDTATSARDTYARQVSLARAEERAQWDRAEVRRLTDERDAAEERERLIRADRDEVRREAHGLRADVKRAEKERDSLARWKAEALEVLAAYRDLARRVVPDPALGRPWSEMLAEHVDRQAAALAEAEQDRDAFSRISKRAIRRAERAEAALAEVRALFREAQWLPSKYTRAPGANGDRVADLLTEDAYRIGTEGLAILDRRQGGEA